MGIEPTRVGSTSRCVNHFATTAIKIHPKIMYQITTFIIIHYFLKKSNQKIIHNIKKINYHSPLDIAKMICYNKNEIINNIKINNRKGDKYKNVC